MTETAEAVTNLQDEVLDNPNETVVDIQNDMLPHKDSNAAQKTTKPSIFRRRFLGLPLYVWLALSALVATGLIIYLIVALTRRSDDDVATEAADTPNSVRPPCDPDVDRFPTKISLDFASQSTIPELDYSNTHVDFTIRTSTSGEAEYRFRLSPADCIPPDAQSRSMIRAQPSALFVAESPTLAYVEAVDPQLSTLSFVPQGNTFFSPTVRSRVSDGLTKEIAENFVSNYSLLTTASTPPQLSLIGEFGIEGFNSAGTDLPWLPVADASAHSPLERAEWIKLIGLILGHETVANRLFDDIQGRYNTLRASVADFPERPSVFFNSPFSGSWAQPGGAQYMAKLAVDAGADYRFADDGSTATQFLSFDDIRTDFRNAEYLLNTGGFPSRDDSTIATFFAEAGSDEERNLYKELRAVRCGSVFSSAARITEGGQSSDVFESGAIRPDLMLADFVDLLHKGRKSGMMYQYWLGPATPDVVGNGQCPEGSQRNVKWDGLEHHFAVKGRGRWEMERIVARARKMLRGMDDISGRRWRLYFTNGGRKGEVGVALRVEVRESERGTPMIRGKMQRLKLVLGNTLGQGAYAISRREFKQRVSLRAAAVRAATTTGTNMN